MTLSNTSIQISLSSESHISLKAHGHQGWTFNPSHIYRLDCSSLRLRRLNLSTIGTIAILEVSLQTFYVIRQRSPLARRLHITISIDYIHRF